MHFMETRGSLREKEAGYEVTRNFVGNVDLRIWGRMPLEWIVNLTGGIARTGGSIVRGTAHRVSGSVWEGRFEFKPAPAGGDPERIDYMQLARTAGVSAPRVAISLDVFSLRSPDMQRRGLSLEIRADDQTGFLGAFLNRLSFFLLFPEEVVIETTAGKVHDSFLLKSAGGMEPTVAVEEALQRYLQGSVAA